MVGSTDMSARVYSIAPMDGFKPFVVTGHKNAIVGCFFDKDSLDVSFHRICI